MIGLLVTCCLFIQIEYTIEATLSNMLIGSLEFIAKSPAVVECTHISKNLLDFNAKKKPFQNTIVRNLNDHLEPFRECFIHITNFQNVDFSQLQIPVMLRQTQIAWSSSFFVIISKALTNNPNVTYDYKTYVKLTPKPCPISNMFAKSVYVCVTLDFQKYVTRSKPWTCEVVVSLLPVTEDYYQKKLDPGWGAPLDDHFPAIFEEDDRSVKYMIPSFSPINILVTKSEQVGLSVTSTNLLGCTSDNVISQWFMHSVHKYPCINKWWCDRSPYISRGTFIMFTAKSLMSTSLELRARQIELNISYFVSTGWNLNKCILHFSTNYFNPTKFFYIGELADYVLGDGYDFQGDEKYNLFMKYLEKTLCSSNTRPTKYIGGVANAKFSLASAWMHVWLRIFTNHTVVAIAKYVAREKAIFSETVTCSGNKLVAEKKSNIDEKLFQLHVVSSMVDDRLDDEIKPIADLLAHSVQLIEPSKAFGFISCGKTLMQPFAFYELTGVFDNYIWIAIIVFFVAVVPTMFCVFEEANFSLLSETLKLKSIADPHKWFMIQTYFAPIRIVFEQGSGFSNKQMNVISLRIIAGSVILVSVVLSNAYKNENVYNMIKARNSIPFWYLNQLQQEKFEILTRLDSFYTEHYDNAEDLKEKYSLHVSSNVFSNHSLNYSTTRKWKGKLTNEKKYIYSELLLTYKNEFEIDKEFLAPKEAERLLQKTINQERLEKLISLTVLHDGFKSFFYENYTKSVVNNSKKHLKKFNKKRKYDPIQRQHLLRYISGCDNKALVLPMSEMQTYFDEIKTSEFSMISFGKETLWDLITAFTLHGHVPDFAIRQLSALPETGLVLFINRTYGIRFSDFAEATFVKNIDKPAMDGNVVIVFVALLVGIAVALLIFTFEMKGKIWSVLTLACTHVLALSSQCRIWKRMRVLVLRS